MVVNKKIAKSSSLAPQISQQTIALSPTRTLLLPLLDSEKQKLVQRLGYVIRIATEGLLNCSPNAADTDHSYKQGIWCDVDNAQIITNIVRELFCGFAPDANSIAEFRMSSIPLSQSHVQTQQFDGDTNYNIDQLLQDLGHERNTRYVQVLRLFRDRYRDNLSVTLDELTQFFQRVSTTPEQSAWVLIGRLNKKLAPYHIKIERQSSYHIVSTG